MSKKRGAFVCVQNSAGSQTAQAWLERLCGDSLNAQSAGIEPGIVNPLAVAVMREVGIDLADQKTKASSIFSKLESASTM